MLVIAERISVGQPSDEGLRDSQTSHSPLQLSLAVLGIPVVVRLAQRELAEFLLAQGREGVQPMAKVRHALEH